jgi:hypothetical protein
VVWALVPLAACAHPVRERAITALGPEATGVSVGPLHRPGQPCLACHDGADSDIAAFSVAGTVYVDDSAAQPAANVRVIVLDADDQRHELTSNCAGNFYVEPERFAPRYPLWAALEFGGDRIEMQSPIGRDGSCAGCHALQASPTRTNAVYLYSVAGELPEGLACP